MIRLNDKNNLDSSRAIISNLVDYFGQIERDYDISISVHTSNRYIDIFNPILKNYNKHVIPYCKVIKSNSVLNKKCVNCQRMVTAKFARRITGTDKYQNVAGHFGQCCFGVEEFVMPICSEGVPVGFISVTGYSSDLDATRHKAMKQFDVTGIYPEGYEEALSLLRSDFPDMKLLTNLLAPVVDLLGFVCVLTKRRIKQVDYSLLSIKSYIETHYSEPISVPVISKMLHCSDSYVNHMFKKRSGSSISNYINEVRVKHAREMLRSTDHTVKDIAIAIGYNDTNYFSSIFKRHAGLTPSKYREKHKKTP